MTTTTGRPMFLVHASVAVTDSQGRLLVVQEEKPASYLKWNLPGGHVDLGEPPPVAGRRETLEETGLDLPVEGLLGIYQSSVSLRFVFVAQLGDEMPRAGDQILAVKFMTIDEVLAMTDEQLVSGKMFRAILRDLKASRRFPLDTFRSLE